MYRHLIIIIAILCGAIKSSAQDSSFIPTTEVATQLAIGSSNRLDTYLSPEKYRGTEFRFISEVLRDSHHHRSKTSPHQGGLLPLTYSLTHEGEIDITRNRADNAKAISGMYDFSYAVMYRWQSASTSTSKWRVLAGAMTDLNLGFSYDTRNSANNPAQGYASLSIGANVMAQYSFTLWKKHFRLNYEARMPFIGIMFSPNYGQSYYEIFNEGNYDHNIVFTSLATFQLRQQLSLDYDISPSRGDSSQRQRQRQRYSLRLGYLCDIRQAKPNNLSQHHWLNAFTLGIIIKK